MALAALAAIALAGCGGSKGAAQPGHNCLRAWNAPNNKTNQTRVAGLYTYAKVVPSAGQTGCEFAFHGDDPPLFLLSARWQGDQLAFGQVPVARELGSLPGGTPPSVVDNVVVNGRGQLRAGRFPASTHIVKPRAAPNWLLLRARRDAWLYSDPSPIAVLINLQGRLWRVKLQGDFLCEVCFKPRARLKHYEFIVEEFDPRTKAAAGVAYTG